MNDNKNTFCPKITFSGAGVLHIKSSDIMKTENAKRQMNALSVLRKNVDFK